MRGAVWPLMKLLLLQTAAWQLSNLHRHDSTGQPSRANVTECQRCLPAKKATRRMYAIFGITANRIGYFWCSAVHVFTVKAQQEVAFMNALPF